MKIMTIQKSVFGVLSFVDMSIKNHPFHIPFLFIKKNLIKNLFLLILIYFWTLQQFYQQNVK